MRDVRRADKRLSREELNERGSKMFALDAEGLIFSAAINDADDIVSGRNDRALACDISTRTRAEGGRGTARKTKMKTARHSLLPETSDRSRRFSLTKGSIPLPRSDKLD